MALSKSWIQRQQDAQRRIHPRPAAAKPAAPAAPAAPAPQQNTFLPQTPQYGAAINAAQRNQTLGLAGLAAQEAQANQAYGFTNPNDPYSKAALLQKSYENQKRATLTGMASGHLYSGSLQRGQDLNQERYNQGFHALRSEYDNLLAGLAQRRAGVANDFQSATEGAAADNLSAALNTPPEDIPPLTPPGRAPNPNASQLHDLRVSRRGTTGKRRQSITRQIKGLR